MSDRFGMPIVDCRTEEERLREQVAAQSAVIEKLLEALLTCQKKQIIYECSPAQNYKTYDSDLVEQALAIPTNNTQILDEVRRAEREKCAKVCEDFAYQHPNTHMLGPELNRLDCAKLILAME